MAGLLADVFSFGDTAKRKVKGLLADPVGTLQQFVGNENDRAGRFNELTNSAAQEMATRIKSGGSGMGASEQRLAGLLADAYNPAGMVVWHGSPHKFAKFDSSKIGTGEGAQAYGHGLYLAESPDVAKAYMTSASQQQDAIAKNNMFLLDGVPMSREQVNEAMSRNGAANLMDYMMDTLAHPTFKMPKRFEGTEKEKIWASVAPRLKLAKAPVDTSTGNLFKVDLPDEHIAKMLDWDKPLSKQHPDVQSALGKYGIDVTDNGYDAKVKAAENAVKNAFERYSANPTNDAYKAFLQLDQEQRSLWNARASDMTGKGAYESIAGDQVDAANLLRQAGIPGIRYLDGGSRGTGQGTSNFVVFPGNENLLQILERNGKPLNGLLD